MNKSAVVILAAGIGSRMEEVTSKTSKCIVDLDGITPLEHTIKSFSDCGVSNIILVVGHHKDKVIDSVVESVKKRDINVELEFIVNNKYNYHGCEYSLSCASSIFDQYDTVYITEGDLLLSKDYVESIVKSDYDSAVLLRGIEFISETRSVVAVDDRPRYMKDAKITKFVYDPDHINVFSKCDSLSIIRGESMQLWKFSNESLELLTSQLKEYYDMVNQSTDPVNHSGLYSINKVIRNIPINGVRVDGEDWINLNTVDDVNHAKQLSWLNR